MSEKEKMLNGKYYNPTDCELKKDRVKARKLIHSLNQLSPAEEVKKKEIIKQLFAKTGKEFSIEPPFYCDYGYNIDVGENFYANFNCIILDVNKVLIGDDVKLGPGVHIYTASHPSDPEERLAKTEYGKKVVIGNNVWLGGGSVILPGIEIGSNTTIGAGSVVTKNIPANVIAVGNPCEVIKKLKKE